MIVRVLLALFGFAGATIATTMIFLDAARANIDRQLFFTPPAAEATLGESATVGSTAHGGSGPAGNSSAMASPAAVVSGTGQNQFGTSGFGAAENRGNTEASSESSLPDLSSPEAFEQFGRVLASMKPDAAADLLVQLDDEAVGRLLLRLPARRSAEILNRMPSDRAARLARLFFDSSSRSTQDSTTS